MSEAEKRKFTTDLIVKTLRDIGGLAQRDVTDTTELRAALSDIFERAMKAIDKEGGV